MGRVAGRACNLITQRSSSRQPSYFSFQQKSFMYTSILSHGMWKRHLIGDWGLIKSIICTVSLRNPWVKLVCVSVSACWWRYMTPSTVCHCCLNLCQGSRSFTHHYFCSRRANVNAVKKANDFLVFCKKFRPHGPVNRVLGIPQGSTDHTIHRQVAERDVLYGTIYKSLNVKNVCCLWILTYVVK